MALLIVADLGSLGVAARQLGQASGAIGSAPGVPSLGEPGADDALNHFSSIIHGHANRLAEAAGRGAESMRGYVVGFHEVGG